MNRIERNDAMRERSKTALADLEAAIQVSLAAIAEIDRWYDWERESLEVYPEAMRNDVAVEIARRQRLNRQPYVLHLAHLHQMIVAARIFGNPAISLRHRRSGVFPPQVASSTDAQDAASAHGKARLKLGPSHSNAGTDRRRAPVVSETHGRGDAD
ncbi:hypothetical protein [Microvirga sp. TS319]|uniref:hypothetical protein n=1 Tax=Microvirga sp. TS319 TaxID=3241165 RepID=UPI00351AA71B